MTVINTNVGALTSRTYALKANDAMEQSMERLSSGLRINSAADDAAGLAVANKMESQLRGMNMAVRNSQDGISLVQTAEAGMSEISNMVIRMRELAVQMNNGIYTDADRTNAQLEVQALIAEIDKIATNSAFNQVKVLDGTYNKEIRAGNTNPEVIQVNIDRMNSDSLGAAILSPTSSSTARSTDVSGATDNGNYATLTATAATTVSIDGNSVFGTAFTGFVSANQGGTFTLSGTDKDDFTYTASATAGQVGVISSTVAQAYAAGGDNVRDLTLTYSQGGNSVTQDIKLTIAENTGVATVRSATSTLSVQETNALSIVTAGGTSSAAGSDNVLSANLKAFVDADRTSGGATQGSFALSGTDKANFSIDANGVLSVASGGAFDFDAPSAQTSFSFNVEYTNSTGDKFTEAVSLTMTDGAEQVQTITSAAIAGVVPDAASNNGVTSIGDTFTVTVGGQAITHTVTTAATDYDLAELATDLNTANTNLGSNAKAVTFTASGNNLVATLGDSVGATSTTISGLTHTAAMTEHGTSTSVTTTGAAAISEVTEVFEIDLAGTLAAGPLAADNLTVKSDNTGANAIVYAVVAGDVDAGSTDAELATAMATAIAADGGYAAANYTIAASGSKLVFSMKAGTGDFDITNASIVNSTAAGRIAAGAATTTTPGVTAVGAVAEVNTMVGVSSTLPTAVKNGDTFVIKDGGSSANKLTATITADDSSFDMDKLVTALNAGTSAGTFPGGSGTFSKAANGTDLLFTRTATGTVTSIDLGKLEYQAANVATGTTTVTTAGSALNATNSHTTAATTSNVGTAAVTRVGSGATGTNVVNGSKVTVTLQEAKSISIGSAARSTSFASFITNNPSGTFSVAGTDKANFTVNSKTGEVTNTGNMDFDTDASHTFDLVYTATSGAKFTETVTLTLTNDATDDGSFVSDINMSTQQGANDAIEILDFAINQISASQSKLGAVQNRLQHNIDNLSMASMVTETAKGRITDADYARETSELSKQQILGQAATSMLAQANQSKQGVLALLQ